MNATCLTKRIILLALSQFLTVLASFGQSPQQALKIIPPSPNAAALAKYGDIPVSTYTGVPNITIPLYEIKVRDISVPISISYHASGIKVSEEASRVGLGWVLNAGGLISRNVVNIDDFFENAGSYLSSTNDAPLIPKGLSSGPIAYVQEPSNVQFFNMTGPSTITSLNLAPYTYDVPHDFEPDQFTYNFLEYSGKFVLDRKADHTGEAILSKQSKIRIKYIGTTATAWEVTTADGYVYKFDAFEYFVDYNNTTGNQQKSAWYLTEIVSPLNEHVTFHYESSPTDQIHPAGGYSELTSPFTLSCQNFNCTPYPTMPGQQIYGMYYSNIYLDRIEWKHGYLKFNMEGRLDLEGDKKLAAIEVYRTGASEPVEVISFSYDYFTSAVVGNAFNTDVSPERLSKRLKLLKVAKQASDNLLEPIEHEFSYYQGQTNDLPTKNSFAQDHWGFYNGRHGNTSFIPVYQIATSPITYNDLIGTMGPQRNPSSAHSTAFSLKEITYPTRGKTTFYYENHDHEPDDLVLPESYQVSSYMFYSGTDKGIIQVDTLDLTDQYVNTFGQTVPVQLYAAFRTSGLCKNTFKSQNIYFELYHADGVSRIGRVELGLPECENSEDNLCIYCDDGEFSQSPVFTYRNTYLLAPGIYIWKAFIASDIPFEDISANYTWWADVEKRPQDNSPLHYRIAGGLRISKIEDYDGENESKVNVRRYDYHYREDTNNNGVLEERSYGKRMAQPSYSYFDLSWESKTEGTVPVTTTCLDCVSLIRVSNSVVPLVNSQGISVGYDRVAEIFGENGELGRIEYEYENQKDQPISYTYGNAQIPIKPAVYPALAFDLNGSVKRQSTFNANGIKVHEVINRYESKHKAIVYGLESRNIRTIGVAGATGLVAFYPALQSSFPYLAETTEKSFSIEGDETIVRRNEFFHDNQTHLQLTKQIAYESNGTKTITQYKYAADYSDVEANDAISAMKSDKHVHDAVVETSIVKEASDGSQKLPYRDFTLYHNVNSGVLPAAKIVLDKTTLTPSQVSAYNPSQPYDEQFYRKLYDINYDDDRNVKEIVKAFDHKESFLWGYDQTLPIAQIKNATASESVHTSFESDGILDLDSRTGTKVWNGSYELLLPSVHGNYKLSYWQKSTASWTLIEQVISVTGTSAASITIGSPDAVIDEVRLYPSNAHMTTYTHDPIIGMTSSTDANNITTFYEYDGFGRLEVVKDSDENIVKHYKYHYKSEQ